VVAPQPTAPATAGGPVQLSGPTVRTVHSGSAAGRSDRPGVDHHRYPVPVSPRRTPIVAGSSARLLALAGLGALAGMLLLHIGSDSARAYLGGIPGRVAVAQCRWVSGHNWKGWDCRGAFTGRGVVIDEVAVRPLLDTRPRGPVPTVVSGPAATTAWTPGPVLLMPASGGLGLIGLTPVLGLVAWWRSGHPRPDPGRTSRSSHPRPTRR
jgi:hypothetical protein